MNILPQWLLRERQTERRGSPTQMSNRVTVGPDDPLFMLSPFDPMTPRMASRGAICFGGVGVGKTTTYGDLSLRSFVRAGMGGYLGLVKNDELARVTRLLEEEHAQDSLVVFSPSNPWRLNYLEYIRKRPGLLGSRTEIMANLVTTMGEIGERSESSGGGKNDKFFQQTNKRTLRNALEICAAGNETLSIKLLDDVIISAPRTHEEVHDPKWQEQAACYRCIVEGDSKSKTAGEQNDFDRAARFFLSEFCDFPADTRGSVLATWGAMADPLLRGDMLELFGGATNVVPDIAFNGVILCADFPTEIYGPGGAMVQGALKYLFKLAAAYRDVSVNPRYAFCYIDEAHALVTESGGVDGASRDSIFLGTTARKANICTVFLSQNISNFYAALGGESAGHNVKALLGNATWKLFFGNGHVETNKFASSLFAKSLQTRTNYSANRGAERDTTSGGGSDMVESKILESEFTELKGAGPGSEFAEAIIFGGGTIFKATGDTYLRTRFRQHR
jgi:TraM recognition site of TraD and TraG